VGVFEGVLEVVLVVIMLVLLFCCGVAPIAVATAKGVGEWII
jgi:hypothetical protein